MLYGNFIVLVHPQQSLDNVSSPVRKRRLKEVWRVLFIEICKLIVNFTDANDFNITFRYLQVFRVLCFHPHYAVKIVLRGNSECFLVFIFDPGNSRENHVDCFVVWQVKPIKLYHITLNVHVNYLSLGAQDHQLLIFVAEIDLVFEILRKHVRIP